MCIESEEKLRKYINLIKINGNEFIRKYWNKNKNSILCVVYVKIENVYCKWINIIKYKIKW